jgi:hypothetical protein
MQITTTGGTPQQRELVTNVMARGLVEHGFSNVALVNTVGEPMVGSNVPSLMEVVRETDPSFLQAPIRIWSIETTDPLDAPGPNDEPVSDKGNGLATAVVDEDPEYGITTSVVVHEPMGGVKATPLNRGSFGNAWLPKTRATDQGHVEVMDEAKREEELNQDFERTKAAAEAAATLEESQAIWAAHQLRVDQEYGIDTALPK